MEYIKFNGQLGNSSFVFFDIKNGNKFNDLNYLVWINKEGNRLELHKQTPVKIIEKVMMLFEKDEHKKQFRTDLRKVNVYF